MNGSTSRTELIIGTDGIERLKNAKITLAGAGAVGGYALEALVRAGVGHIRVIDGDTISKSNINRQILATYKTIGMKKAKVAKKRAVSINPNIELETITTLLTKDNVKELVGEPDIIVDAIDTIENKSSLLRYASKMNIRTFSSMGAALHIDTTQIRVAELKKTKVCPLAASLRSKLKDTDTSMITCVYSEENPVITPSDRDEHGKSILGSLPTVPAVFGMTLANEVIREIVRNER